MSAEQTPDIAAVLARCRCHDVHGDTYTPPYCESCRSWAAHVAAALAPVLAAAVREAEQRAWYEGWNARTSGRARDWRNPYRADRITEPASHEAATSGKEECVMELVESWSVEPMVGVLVNGKPLGIAVEQEGPMVEPIPANEHLHIVWMPLLAKGPAPRTGRPDGEPAGVSDE